MILLGVLRHVAAQSAMWHYWAFLQKECNGDVGHYVCNKIK
ncbi:hypothetical protein HanIR_Chr16g0839411 [Helianthus annuus]|nr:hypothetical protein HanIR_Chr16g0839411 [Helianthus annuus]